MKAMPRKLLDKFQIVGFAVSTIVSVALIFFGQDEIESVILGLVLATLVQMFDIQLRQSDSEDKILRAQTLTQILYEDKWLLDHIQQIVDSYYLVKETWFELFRTQADSAILECRDTVHSLSQGIMYVERRSHISFGSQGIKSAKKSLKGVTMGGKSYWGSIHGERYINENMEAINRGVKIRRIFLNSQENIQKMIDIIQKHQSIGVDVYIAFVDDVPRDLHDDFVIMDDSLVNCAEYESTGRFKRARVSLRLSEVEQMKRKFNVILRSARKLEEAINQLQSSAVVNP